jgi:YegS/Rv2252/BmrU family lipid kinase
VILNPAAGRGRGAHARQPVEQALRQAGATYDLTETSGPGDAGIIAAAAVSAGYDVIVTVGGDGTAHEAAHGLAEAARTRGNWRDGRSIGVLGIIPVGTGNDFAWRLGIPDNDVAGACEVLLADQRRVVDLGQLTDETGATEIFINHLGGGFEAAANIESRKIRRLSGLLLYLVAVLRVIPQYSKGREATIHYNGTHETRPILLASAANGGRSGGGFKIAPDARLDDGKLDLVLANSPNAAVILYLLPHFLRGTHGSQTRYVAMTQTEHFVVEAPTGLPVHLDGEIYRASAHRLEVCVLPQRLTVIAARPD